MKILVVDDSKAARMLLTSLLTEYDKSIILLEASNGQEGLSLFKENQPDITFLDLTMPVMDGYEALEKMKAFDSEKKVIILTADIQTKARERCQALGADGMLKKLPQKEELFASLDKIIKGGKL